jgi:hypothetical protein
MTPDKTPYHLLDWPFVAAMAETMRGGADRPGRTPGGWRNVSPDLLDEYFSAAIRHLVAGDYATAACNMMIMAHLSGERNAADRVAAMRAALQK